VILLGAAIPLLAAACLAQAARPAARRLPPSTAVPLLAGAAVVVSATTGFVLAVVAFTTAGTDAEVAEMGHWSAPVVARLDEIPRPLGAVAGGVLLLLLASTMRRGARGVRTLWAADAECRRLGAGVDGLIIVDDERADAYALPGLRGRVVVSRGMLAALSPPERRVLLAHERSHIDHRHALFVELTEVAVAACPVLAPVARAVRDGVERWADEDAAAAVGDRLLAARSLARAAMAASPLPGRYVEGAPLLGMTDGTVAARARALVAPAPRPRRTVAALVLACTLAAAVGAVIVEHSAEDTFERAGMVSATR
jgi:Zn-dependent protease with chaperone function